MPTLNSDGSINTSTDGTWDWKAGHTQEEQDAARYEITKAWTLASMKFNKQLFQPKSRTNIKVIPGKKELVLCFNTDIHLATLLGTPLENVPAQYIRYPDAYSSESGPAPELPTEISISVDLFNGTDSTIIFDKLHVDYFGGGIYGYEPSDPLYSKYQPYCSRLASMDIDWTDSLFWISDEDEEKLHEMFGDFPTETTPYRPQHQIDFNTPVGQYIQIESCGLLHIVNIVIRPTQTRKIKYGSRTREIVSRFFGLYAGFNGAYGTGEEAGGYASATSYAYDTIREMKVGLASHCEFDRQYGAWKDADQDIPSDEPWEFDEPSPPPLFPDKGQNSTRSRRNSTPSRIRGNIFVRNRTNNNQYMRMNLYGATLVFLIPPSFVGYMPFEIPIYARMIESPTVETIVPQVDVTVPDGVEATGIRWYVENDMSIPVDFWTEQTGQDKVRFRDGLLCFIVAGAPEPDAEDQLELTDDIVLAVRTQIKEETSTTVELTDDINITHTEIITGEVKEKPVITDSLLLNIGGAVKNEVTDELALTDNVSITVSSEET